METLDSPPWLCVKTWVPKLGELHQQTAERFQAEASLALIAEEAVCNRYGVAPRKDLGVAQN